MRILICDDDVLIQERLQKCISDFFRNNKLKCPELLTFDSGETLLADKGTKILFSGCRNARCQWHLYRQ